MARRILNRKELREEHDASERIEEEEVDERDEDEEEEEKESKPVKKAVKRKPRAKASKKEVRLKAFWGVFSQSLSQAAQFEYSQRADAVKKAAELSESRKSPHFVQLVKKVIEE